jgi:hypothetical protein
MLVIGNGRIPLPPSLVLVDGHEVSITNRGGRRSFTWTDYRDLLIAAHRHVSASVVLVWDNLNVHRDRRLREFIDTHDWVTCYFLPAYAPDLNPGRGHLVTAATQQPGQHHLHRPRPPHQHTPARHPSDSIPQ